MRWKNSPLQVFYHPQLPEDALPDPAQFLKKLLSIRKSTEPVNNQEYHNQPESEY